MTNKPKLAAENVADETPPPYDPFDPVNLRITEDVEALGVKRILTTCPVRKPNRHEFFRIHTGENYTMAAALLKLENDGEFYIFAPAVLPYVPGETKRHQIFTTITRGGTVCLWPIALPDADGKTSNWAKSAFEAAALARTQWVRITSDRALGAYLILAADNKALADPAWPADLPTFGGLLRLGFKDHFVDRPDHELIKQLHGR
jgi:hypothetical protein